MRTRTLAAAPLAAIALLAACGGGDGEDDSGGADRSALYADGMTDDNIDCIVEEMGLSVEQMVEFSQDNAAGEAYFAGLDADGIAAFERCAGELTSLDEEEGGDDPELAEEGDGDRSALYDTLTDDEIDCVLDSTSLTVADLIEYDEQGTVDGEDLPVDTLDLLIGCLT